MVDEARFYSRRTTDQVKSAVVSWEYPNPAACGIFSLPVGTWLSLVEHSLGVRGVGSSNLPVPTILQNQL